MKTIGMIGGMAWPSTITFYRAINEQVAMRLGENGLHCAKLLLSQTDFHEVERCQTLGDWERVARLVGEQAQKLKAAGADFFVIACNTVHKVYDQIVNYSDLPCIHIADPVGEFACRKGCRKIGLMGSKYTMEGTYFTDRLRKNYGLEVVLPSAEGRESINDALYQELTRGIIRDQTRQTFLRCIGELANRGAEMIVLGCTEFDLIIKEEDSPLPLVDTTLALAKAAVDRALEEEP